MTVLEARSVFFEATGGTTILDGVDLVAQPGAVTAIVGPNGAGKSTLLRLLAGLATPSAGEILIDGRPVASFSVAELARLRAYMSSRLPERISFPVREVVRMGRHPWTSTRRESESAVDRSIAELKLETLADRAHSTLSTGEARRTHVARILAQDAGLMMLDEPESGLDIGYAELVLDRLRGAARRPGTVVAALHDLNAAARIADRVVLLDCGRVISDGRPDEVLTGDLLTRVYRHPVEVIPHPGGAGLLVLPRRSDEPGPVG